MSGMGKRIQALREERGFSRAELARLTGMSQPAVYNWEEKDMRPRGGAMTNLCNVLGTSEEYLRTGAEPDLSNNPVPFPPHTVESVLADAKAALAQILGLDENKLRLRFEVEG